MNPKHIIQSFMLSALLVAPLRGQTFDSGSDGSYGPLNITADTTLALPADGIFRCTTITVASGQTLRFSRNPLNTPVYLLATGDVSILGVIDVSATEPVDGNGSITGGTGGPGGFDGGASGHLGGAANRAAGSGQGPGGGKRGTNTNDVGSGSYANTAGNGSAANGTIYGNALLIPLIGGSGGGGIDGMNYGYGGGGGGAILIASNTRITVAGHIYANGGSYNSQNCGSGGAVRLVAPRVFGGGSINVLASGGSYWGGDGRIRIDSMLKVDPLDLTQYLHLAMQGNTSVGANMIVFPPPIRIDVIEAAGTVIAEGASAPVFVSLPYGANPAKTVKVQARGFGGVVPIRVALIPDTGDSITYDASIDNTTINPATTTVNVTMPINSTVQVQVWTR